MVAGKSIECFSGGEAVGVVDCETIPKVSQSCAAFMKFVSDRSQEEKSIVINKFGACSCHIQRSVVLSGTLNLVTLQQGSQVLVKLAGTVFLPLGMHWMHSPQAWQHWLPEEDRDGLALHGRVRLLGETHPITPPRGHT